MSPIATTPPQDGRTTHNWLTMTVLIIVGEAAFLLPFVLPRVFRPTLMDVFGISNWELGVAFSAYGIVAMIAYLPSGPLADIFSPRKLMSLALLLTGAGGILLATGPNLRELCWLYAFWGMSTILLLWSALIRATREWGGSDLQGLAFGLFDGGRGFVAALIGVCSALLFAAWMPEDVEAATKAQRADAFLQVILLFTGITLAAGILVWFAIPDERRGRAENQRPRGGKRFIVRDAAGVLAMPAVWLQALVVVSAYVAYKGLDDVSLYAKEVLLMDEVDAAFTGTLSMWVRPFSAIAAGLIADRWHVTRTLTASFTLLAVGCMVFASGWIQPGMLPLFYVSIVGTSAAVFACRGLYFAIMQEGQVPLQYTGTAVGVVSAIGYLPDVFMGPLMGLLLDHAPGTTGHQYVFGVVGGFALLGMVTSLVYQRVAVDPTA